MVREGRLLQGVTGLWGRAGAMLALGFMLLTALCAAPGAFAGPVGIGAQADASTAFSAPATGGFSRNALFSRPKTAPPFTVTAQRAGEQALLLQWAIRPDTYLYRNSISASVDGRPLAFALPPGVEKDDPNFGLVRIFHNALEVRIAAADVPASGVLHVTWQGCSDQGICYPPESGTLDLSKLGGGALPLVAAEPGLPDRLSMTAPAAAAVALPAPASAGAATGGADGASVAVVADARAGPSEALSSWSPAAVLTGDLLWMMAVFLGFGLLLSLTPCMFPMIPILGGVLARSGQQSVGRGVALSSAYVLAMACAYGLLGLVAGWSGANLQAALQTPWALGVMAAIFVILALSMFGLFDMQMPSALSSRFSGVMPGRGGSLGSAAMLGFGSALIVGPCVTPPLAAAMLTAAQTGAAGRGAAALFMLGLGMGLPLIAFGAFGARVLPRSGPWLARVKGIFGLIFLAVAVFLATRLMDGAQALAVWGVFALGLAVFLGGFDRLETGAGLSQRMGKASGLALAVYGALLITGFAGGADDPMRPLGFLSSPVAEGGEAALQRQVVTDMDGFEAALARAGAEGRPALVSFTADWCTVCKSNEKVLAAPALAATLEQAVFIAADVTNYGQESRALMDRFNIIGPPTMFVMDPAGHEVPGSRMIGAISAEGLSRTLGAATGG